MNNNPRVMAEVALEFDTGKFAVYSSEIGLNPGEWPALLTTDLGNGLPLRLTTTHRHLLSSGGMIYKQELGCIQVSVLDT